jgi:hypothetical protein
VVAPFRLDTRASFAVMRVTGTPHTWPNAQGAWDDGRLHEWPAFKTDRSMGFYARDDIPTAVPWSGTNDPPGAVFHVYDRRHLDRAPRRFTVEPGKHLTVAWDLADDAGEYDLWPIAPGGFHRHLTGSAAARAAAPEVEVAHLEIALRNRGVAPVELVLRANACTRDEHRVVLAAGQERVRRWSLERSARWYDISVLAPAIPGFLRRFAGRVETGRDSLSDPAMGGAAHGDQA